MTSTSRASRTHVQRSTPTDVIADGKDLIHIESRQTIRRIATYGATIATHTCQC